MREITWEGSVWQVVHLPGIKLYFFRTSGWNTKYVNVSYEDVEYTSLSCGKYEKPHETVKLHIKRDTLGLRSLKHLVIDDQNRLNEIKVDLLPDILEDEFRA
jgi:hypothetical protein